MSKLLTLGILQQVQNGQGGGLLYDGEMTVGDVNDGLYESWVGCGTVYIEDDIGFGGINPDNVSGWSNCYVSEVFDPMDFSSVYSFYSNYPNIGSVLTHYEFGGTVYTSTESLYYYLSGQSSSTISLKVYEDAQ